MCAIVAKPRSSGPELNNNEFYFCNPQALFISMRKVPNTKKNLGTGLDGFQDGRGG